MNGNRCAGAVPQAQAVRHLSLSYLSVCSGIEAATVAWQPLGFRPLAFSEIEPFPRAVLAHHYPDVPLHGDFTLLRDEDWIADADILVGGTPCQGFSIAGLRRSLDDARGNLTLEFLRLADAIDERRAERGLPPCIIVWENVPGVLSVRDNAFGCFLSGLSGEEPPSFRHGENGRTRVWLLDPRAQSRGGSSTPNFSDWPNAAVVCSLSQVLERGSIPQRYFLSSKACAGILRRAEKRGKTLPPMLHQALASVAATGTA